MQTRKYSIIVADDHPPLREGLIRILEKEDFISTLTEAQNGEEVIALLKKQNYDLVLMDIRMPKMCGLQATQIIQTKFPKTKILAISMFDDLRMIDEMKSAGVSGYILKSTKRDEISEAIKTIVQGGHHFQKSNQLQKKNENLFRLITQKDNGPKAEHLREIIYLLCIGKITKQIASILNLSSRTIERYRMELNEHIDLGNVAGVIRYGIDHGILEDEILKIKFEKYESKYNLVI